MTPQTPAERQEATDLKNVQTLADAISKAIGENKNDNRFFDMTRIPLICLSITGIHTSIEEVKGMVKDLNNKFVSQEAFKPYKAAMNIVGTLLLVAVVTAIFTLVIKK